MDKKELALQTLKDLAANFLYYDRKDDEELSREDIETLINSKQLTVDEMVDAFKQALVEGIEDKSG